MMGDIGTRLGLSSSEIDHLTFLVREHLADTVALPPGLEWEVRYTAERQRTWTGREEVREMFGPGFLMDPDDPVVRAAVRGVASVTGSAPTVRPWTFATDGRYTRGEHGIPTIGYAPGEERHAHTSAERLALGPAQVVFEAYPSVIRELFGALAL